MLCSQDCSFYDRSEPHFIAWEHNMERPIFKPIGTPVTELDTPALVVDLDQLEHNLNTVHAFFQQQTARLRPLVSTHGCPPLAHKQLAAGGTVGGIATTTLSQAEIFVAHGFSDILIANMFATPAKCRRLGALASQATLTVTVDHPSHVQLLSEMAASQQVPLQILIELDTGANRCGIAPGPAVQELAQAVTQAPQLTFIGLMTTAASSESSLAQPLQPLLDARRDLSQAGFEIPVVSVRSDGRYEEIAALDGITEICTGTYALMDAQNRQPLSPLQPAARVLTTVTSCPEPGLGIADTGQKAMGMDLGLPTVDDLPGVKVIGLNAEHCHLQLGGETADPLKLGDKLWLTPWDMSTCANLYDTFYAARQGKLALAWPIAARGHYR